MALEKFYIVYGIPKDGVKDWRGNNRTFTKSDVEWFDDPVICHDHADNRDRDHNNREEHKDLLLDLQNVLRQQIHGVIHSDIAHALSG